MKLPVVLLLMAISLSLCGQFEPREDEMPDKVNSLGVNITPVAVLFMNGESYSPRYSLTYRRQLAPNFNLRATGGFETRARWAQSYSEAPVIGYTDTTITYQLFEQHDYDIDMRFGMEWFKPNKNTMVYGVDAIIGYGTEQLSNVIVPRYFNGEYEVASPFEPQVRNHQKIDYLFAGFDFSIGPKLIIDDTFYFLINWTPQFVYRWPIKEEYSDPEMREYPPEQYVEMRLRGIEILLNVQI